MRAITLKEFGPAENLTYETIDDPVPAAGELRIAVRAIGVQQIETALRAGLPIGPPLPQLPVVFGNEVAGVVDAVGPDVDESWIGRRVTTAAPRPGGYTELAVARIDAVHLIPDELDYRTAVALIVTGATTVGMLRYATISPEDVVLVTSAAGGIGQLLISHLKSIGATVVGAAGGPEKTAMVRDLGADLAVDYRQPAWPERVRNGAGSGDRPITVVLDGVGGDVSEAAFDLLADGGQLVLIGSSSRTDFTPDPARVSERGLRFTHALEQLAGAKEQYGTFAEEALRAAVEGSFVPGLHAFPLSAAAEAHRAIEARQTSGKVVLEP